MSEIFTSLVGKSDISDGSLIKQWETNSIVYSCVNMNANTFAEAASHYRLFQKQRGELVEIDDHPILTTLAEVNESLDQFSLFYAMSSTLDVLGRVYWFIDPENSEMIDMLPSHAVKPVTNTQGLIVAYKYRTQREELTLAKENIIDFRLPAIRNLYSHFQSPLAACMKHAELVLVNAQYERDVIDNKGTARWIFTPKEEVSQEELDRIQNEIDVRLVDRRRAVIGIGAAGTLTAMQINPEDVAALQITSEAHRIICNTFGIPEGLMVKDANRSSAEVAERQYAKQFVAPRLKLVEQRLNQIFAPMFGENLFIKFDNPIPEDKEFKLMYAEKADRSTVLTINEKRELWGFESIADGDIIDRDVKTEEPQPEKKSLEINDFVEISAKVHSGILPRSSAITILANKYEMDERVIEKMVGYPHIPKPDEDFVKDIIERTVAKFSAIKEVIPPSPVEIEQEDEEECEELTLTGLLQETLSE